MRGAQIKAEMMELDRFASLISDVNLVRNWLGGAEGEAVLRSVSAWVMANGTNDRAVLKIRTGSSRGSGDCPGNRSDNGSDEGDSVSL